MRAPDATPVVSLLDQPRFEVLPLAGVNEQAASAPEDATLTVTCSPKKGLEPTLALAEELAGSGLRVVPHLPARHVRDRGHLEEVVRRLEAAGVDEIFVVGGDLPEPVGDFENGLALLEAMAELGARFPRVGVPAYPEGHPHIDDVTLLAALLAKQPYADYLVTQMSFDAAAILDWLREARRAGVWLPAYIGLPGVVDRAALLRTALRIGVGDSRRFISGHRHLARGLLEPHVSNDLAYELAARVEPADRVAGVHLYTFNRVAPTAAWLATTRG